MTHPEPNPEHRPELIEGSFEVPTGLGCRQARRLLSVRREWTVQEEFQAEHHLTGCPACQAIAREYELMDRRLDRLPRPAPAATVWAPAAAQGPNVAARSVYWQPATGRIPAIPWLSLVALVALVAAAALVWQAGGPTPIPAPGILPAAPATIPSRTPNPAATKPETMSLTWPVPGYVSQSYSSDHPAVDIANDTGTPVRTAASGIIIRAGRDHEGYGVYILADHGQGYTSFYAHLSAIQVQDGEQVEKGQIIGLVGSTGLSTGPHLHFEIQKDGVPLNPFEVMPGDLWFDKLTPGPPPGTLIPGDSGISRFTWPTAGHVTQAYSGDHQALDITNRARTPVYATASGIVVRTGQDAENGLYVLLDHADEYSSFYSHLSLTRVEAGEHVEKGQQIGQMGSTGLSTGPHLHFQIQRESKPINPLDLLLSGNE